MRSLASGLVTTKSKKKKRVVELSDLELSFDREYVPGDDSLSEGEEEEVVLKVQILYYSHKNYLSSRVHIAQFNNSN